jgi:hypothetical protein
MGLYLISTHTIEVKTLGYPRIESGVKPNLRKCGDPAISISPMLIH